MKYIKTQNGSFLHTIENPYTNIEWDTNVFCSCIALTPEQMLEYGVELLVEHEEPQYNRLLQRVEETTPVLVDGRWNQQWLIIQLSTEEALTKRAEAIDSRWNLIKNDRDIRKSGGIFVANKWFHSDTESRIQQLGLVLMGNSVPAVQWKTMDKSFITMSPTIASGIFQATAMLDTQLFEVAEGHRLAMEASDRPDLYDFSLGWPAAFN